MNKMEKLGTCRRGQIVSSQMYIVVWFTCIVLYHHMCTGKSNDKINEQA